jgi:hypothetical protein
MSNSVTYNHPVDDPLYAAHKVVRQFDDTQSRNYTRYMADDPFKVVSCVQQVSTQHIHKCVSKLIRCFRMRYATPVSAKTTFALHSNTDPSTI